MSLQVLLTLGEVFPRLNRELPDKKTINKRTDDVPIKIIKVCGGALIKFVSANINHIAVI